MNVYSLFQDRVIEHTKTLIADHEDAKQIDLSRVVVEPPRDASHGDMATNVAMVLAKRLGEKPRDFAEKIAALLRADPDIADISVAGPGFINFRLETAFWTAHLSEILKVGDYYGANFVDSPRNINVEYVSANPTGPMHVGHCRGAVVGDAVANLLDFAGHNVTREYYINDAGVQIDVLANSVMLRYREALGEEIGEVPEGLYPGEYLIPVGKKLAETHGEELLKMGEDEWMPIVKDLTIDMMMDLIREDLGLLNVHHDVFFSERTLHEAGDNGGSAITTMLEQLSDRDIVYVGTLPPPKGQLPEDWEDRPQTLLRSTDFGDDIDRPLIKSDGSYTYFAADVAYFKDKFERGFDDTLFVLGADHAGYVKRLEAVAAAVSGGKTTLSCLLCQLVKLMRAGEPVKMSKRSGNLITLRDVVEEVGVDPVRFMMLYRKSDAPLDFDFEKVTEQSKDNPVFYVQYAHARTHSVYNMAHEKAGLTEKDWLNPNLERLARLDDAAEIDLIKKLAVFPRTLQNAVATREPHRVAFYLYDLASSFHAHWNLGKDRPELRFINPDDRDLTIARLALVAAVNAVLKAGLSIMGVSAPEEMR